MYYVLRASMKIKSCQAVHKGEVSTGLKNTQEFIPGIVETRPKNSPQFAQTNNKQDLRTTTGGVQQQGRDAWRRPGVRGRLRYVPSKSRFEFGAQSS
jgi:hypothetical protein